MSDKKSKAQELLEKLDKIEASRSSAKSFLDKKEEDATPQASQTNFDEDIKQQKQKIEAETHLSFHKTLRYSIYTIAIFANGLIVFLIGAFIFLIAVYLYFTVWYDPINSIPRLEIGAILSKIIDYLSGAAILLTGRMLYTAMQSKYDINKRE